MLPLAISKINITNGAFMSDVSDNSPFWFPFPLPLIWYCPHSGSCSSFLFDFFFEIFFLDACFLSDAGVSFLESFVCSVLLDGSLSFVHFALILSPDSMNH